MVFEQSEIEGEVDQVSDAINLREEIAMLEETKQGGLHMGGSSILHPNMKQNLLMSSSAAQGIKQKKKTGYDSPSALNINENSESIVSPIADSPLKADGL